MIEITYYRDNSGDYHGVTNQSPKGFKGVILVGRGPCPPNNSVKERAYSPDILKFWTEVEAADVPDDWFDAIKYEERPEPTPIPVFEIKDADRVPGMQDLVRRLAAGEKPPEPNFKRLKNHFKFKLVDIDERYSFEILPSKRADEVLVRVTKKLEAGETRVVLGYTSVKQAEPRHDREPAPVEITEVTEVTELEILPSRQGNPMDDPLFWPFAIIVGVILFTLFRGCF